MNADETTALMLVLSAGLYAQSAGIPTATTRQLNEVTEMGRPKVKPQTDPRSLTFEESDDPTVGAHATSSHEPSRAARKAAQQAEHLAKKTRHSEAASKYREAADLDPRYYEAWNNLGLELEAAGKPDESADVFRHLIQTAPEHVLAFTNLATMLARQHRYADAEAVARQALKTHAYSFKANYTLGIVLVDEGKWNDEAKSKLEYSQLKYPEAKNLLSKWPAKSTAQ